MRIYLYLCASIGIFILGISHIAIELFQNQILDPVDPELHKSMMEHRIKVFRFTRSFDELMHGFSLTMGVFMAAYGSLNFLIVRKFKQFILLTPIISFFNAFFCLFVCILSVIYFHWPPIIFFFIACILFLIVALYREKVKY